MVFVKNLNVFSGYFLDKLSKKSLCFVILGKKECFLGEKSGVLKKSKKSKFSIGIFLAKLSQKLLSFDILDGKECFLDQKSEIFKKSEKSTFSEGVSPWFFQKFEYFLMAIFWTN